MKANITTRNRKSRKYSKYMQDESLKSDGFILHVGLELSIYPVLQLSGFIQFCPGQFKRFVQAESGQNDFLLVFCKFVTSHRENLSSRDEIMRFLHSISVHWCLLELAD